MFVAHRNESSSLSKKGLCSKSSPPPPSPQTLFLFSLSLLRPYHLFLLLTAVPPPQTPLKHSKMYPNPSLGTILIPISTASLGIILPFSGTNYGRHGDEELFRAQPRPLIIPLIDAPTRALPPPYLLPILLVFPYPSFRLAPPLPPPYLLPILLIFPYPFFPPASLLPAYFLPFLLSFSSLYAPLPLSASSFQFSPHFPFFNFLKSCSIFPFLLRSPYCVPPPTFCHLPPSFFLLTTSRPPFQLLLRPLFYLLADLRENSVCPL